MNKEVMAIIENKQHKRGHVHPDGYYYVSINEGIGDIRVVNGRVIWYWSADYEDRGKANKTNIEKAIKEIKKVEKEVNYNR